MKRQRTGKIEGIGSFTVFLIFTSILSSPSVIAAPIPSPTTAGAMLPFSLEIAPAAILPLADCSSDFPFGGGVAIDAAFSPWSLPLSLRGGLQYGYDTTSATPTLSLIAASAGAGYEIRIVSFLAPGLNAEGGLTYCYFSAYLKAGAALRLKLGPSFSNEKSI